MSVELSVQGVRAGYGSLEVLHGLDLAVPTGGVTALLGPNGAGKTTTLALLAGLVRARAGRVAWAGTDLAGWSAYQRARAGMLLVPERRGIFTDLSVRENLELFAGQRGAGFGDALDTFPVLAERLDQHAGTLSGGEQQMLAMGRVLVQRPRLLLIDEISFGLAPRITAQLFEVVAELARAGTTVVLVEQYVEQALRLADVVYVLSRGQVAFVGEPGEAALARHLRAQGE